MLENFKQMEKVEFNPKPYVTSNDCSEAIKELNKYINKINDLYKKDQNSFAELCYYVYKVKELFNNYEKTFYNRVVRSRDGSCYSFETIMYNFGIDSTQSSRLISCYEKFVECIEDKPRIKESFFGFSKSKLFELITVSTEQLEVDISNKVLRSEMSVATIREYVKNYKAQQKQNEKLLEQPEEKQESYDEPFDESKIEMAYDPSKHYDFEYFEKKTKSQLLNIVMDLQKEYEKLKTNYNKIKRSK